MHFLIRHFKHLLAILLATTLLLGCAQTSPAYVPPDQRPVALQEKPWPQNKYLVLAYHSVEDDQADQTFLAVRSDQLVAQLTWLRENQYTPITIDQILAARDGGPSLPSKAVLLTFDDGYRDFYTRVLPILRSFNWPAVLAPVGSWIQTPQDKPVMFGDTPKPRDKFLSEDELRQVAKSPLVEIGAHTYDSHKGLQANPQGNQLPAFVNRLYFSQLQRYETDEEYEARINKDAELITRMIKKVTGKSPRVFVWPYGAPNGIAERILRKYGYQIFMSLDDGLADVKKPENVPRILMSGRDSIRGVAQRFTAVAEPSTMRVAHVDLDYVYDPDPVQQGKNLDALIQRVADLQANTVFLQAFADAKGDGLVREVYFPNRVLPMRADLFNRVSWQLQSRARVKVYAWMPVLALNLDATHPRVTRWNPDTGKASIDPKQYQRLSPFNAANRAAIGKLYEDLSSHSNFDGVLFHDDALMSDFEDASPDALRAYAAAGLPTDISDIRRNPDLMQRWSRLKSTALTSFTQELMAKVHAVRGPQVKSARNIYAEPVLNPKAEEWFAQNFADFLKTYTWTAPMAMPLMEGSNYPQSLQWLRQLTQAVQQYPGAMDRTVFELQAQDWRKKNEAENASATKGPIDSQVIANWMRELQINGVRSFGYYPDDFHNDQPQLKLIRPQLSNSWFPAP